MLTIMLAGLAGLDAAHPGFLAGLDRRRTHFGIVRVDSWPS